MHSKPGILFVVNPASGRKNIAYHLRKLHKYHHLADVKISHSPGNCAGIVKTHLNDYHTFVAMGGDGTVNEIASQLINTGKTMAVFPIGSGNGFAREMGFKRKINELINAIQRGKTIDIDTFQVNGLLSVNVSGIGFDAEVAYSFSKTKRRGFLNYIFQSIETFSNFKPLETIINTGERRLNGKYFMACVSNTRQFGNGAIISPDSNPCDGTFELVLVKKLTISQVPQFVLRMFTSKLKPTENIEIITGLTNISIATSFQHFHTDGEPFLNDKTLEICVLPQSLRITDTGKQL